MDEQELDRMLPGWRVLSDAVGRELIAWREASESQPESDRRRGVRGDATPPGPSAATGGPGQRGGQCGGTTGCRATKLSDVWWSAGAAWSPTADDPTSPDNVQRWRLIAATPCAPSAEPVFFPVPAEPAAGMKQ